MYVIIAPIKIKEEFKERFIEEMLLDAKGSMKSEPGCLRFDVIQDGDDPNKIWLYEVYVDEAAFQAHLEAPHFIRWRDAVEDWVAEKPEEGRAIGASVIWPPREEWGK